MLNLIIALALVTGDPDSEVTDFPYLMPLVQQVAIKLEVLDERERIHVFARSNDFVTDIKIVRRRYQELIGAPPLCDCIRFPGKEYLLEMIEFNRGYNYHLEARLHFDPHQSISVHDIICENDRIYRVYDLARDAQQDYYSITTRRHALQKLRDEIGPQAYYAGCLPAPVPVWRLQKRD